MAVAALEHADQLAEIVATLADLRHHGTAPYDIAVALPSEAAMNEPWPLDSWPDVWVYRAGLQCTCEPRGGHRPSDIGVAVATETRKNAKSVKPHEALIAAIRDASGAISGNELHKAVLAAGQPESTWKKWKDSLGGWIVLHPRISAVGAGGSKRYQWTEPIDPETTLGLLAQRVRAPDWLREAWREVIADGLSAPGGMNPRLRAAQERQAKINVVRAVAEMAIEIEEIAHNGADSEQIVKRVRSAAALRELTPIGEAGMDTGFDPATHKLQFGDPTPGMPVFIMKPGYTWHYGDDVILIEHALVAAA